MTDDQKALEQLASRQSRLLLIAARLIIGLCALQLISVVLGLVLLVQLSIAPKDVYHMVDERFIRIEKHLGIDEHE